MYRVLGLVRRARHSSHKRLHNKHTCAAQYATVRSACATQNVSATPADNVSRAVCEATFGTKALPIPCAITNHQYLAATHSYLRSAVSYSQEVARTLQCSVPGMDSPGRAELCARAVPGAAVPSDGGSIGGVARSIGAAVRVSAKGHRYYSSARRGSGPAALTRLIQLARTLDALETIYQRHSGQMNAVHVDMMIQRLADVCHSADAQQMGRVVALLDGLADVLRSLLPSCTPRTLSSVLS